MKKQKKGIIYISYNSEDKERVYNLKDNIENLIEEGCCSLTAINNVHDEEINSHLINICKVFILVYSSKFSLLNERERNLIIKQLRFISSQNDKRIVLITLDILEIPEWIENVLPRQQITQLSNQKAMQVFYKTLKIRIKESIQEKIDALPQQIFKVGNLHYRATRGENAVEVISIGGDKAPTNEGNVFLGALVSAHYREELVIPATIQYGKYEYDVIGIGRFAFCHSYGFRSIIIPNTIKYIGEYAFCDSSIISITIPDSVTSIGECAFKDCSVLEDITLPKHITSLEDSLFKECIELRSITIPNCVESIGEGIFIGCKSLKSITIPNSVKKIVGGKFNEFISSITVEDGNKYYDSRNNCNAIIDTSRDTLIAGSNNTIIPESIRCIDKEVFYENRSIESIVIPNGVLKIAKYAFTNCWNLKSVEISDSVLIIEDNAFAYCDKLSSVTLGRNIAKIGEYAFYNVSHYTNNDINRLPTIYVPKGLKVKYLNMLHEDFRNKIIEL